MIVVNQEKAERPEELVALCPFGAIEYANGYLGVTQSCRMCMLCVRRGPVGVFEAEEEGSEPTIDKTAWSGIAVLAEVEDGRLHPVGLELLGKARELAAVSGEPTVALVIGRRVRAVAAALRSYGADRVVIYDDPDLAYFRSEPYATALVDFVRLIHPATVLVGGTSIGRSLAPRAAARLRSGLTADCTRLVMSEDGELSQIRPAFGGNIMAHILTPNHRPQFATVRHKIFPVPEAGEPNALGGQVADGVDTDELEPLPGAVGMYVRDCSRLDLASGITVLGVAERPKVKGIEEADVLVVAGRGIRKQEDLATIKRLCELLGAEIAGTRSLIEAGWVDPRRQIGLSGRTVTPKLLITVGVSGAIQFTAGMEGAEHVIAINSDPEARIFEFADTCVHGDLYEIVPRLIAKLESRVGEEGVAV